MSLYLLALSVSLLAKYIILINGWSLLSPITYLHPPLTLGTGVCIFAVPLDVNGSINTNTLSLLAEAMATDAVVTETDI